MLDTDDVINDERVILKLCEALRLDPLHVKFLWKKISVDQHRRQSALDVRFFDTLNNSTGIIRSNGENGEIDIEKEAISWAEEFSSEVGAALEKYARLAMPDYRYLREFRFRPSQGNGHETEMPTIPQACC